MGFLRCILSSISESSNSGGWWIPALIKTALPGPRQEKLKEIGAESAPVRVRNFTHINIHGGIHGLLVEARALADHALAALLVQVEVRVRRLEPVWKSTSECCGAFTPSTRLVSISLP